MGSWLPIAVKRESPDWIFLMIGTNDINSNMTPTEELKTLVNKIIDENDDVQILLATVVPYGNDAAKNQLVNNYNDEIKKYDNDKKDQIHVADINSAFGTEEVKKYYSIDFPDEESSHDDPLHPRKLDSNCESGYDLIAKIWFEEFEDALKDVATMAPAHPRDQLSDVVQRELNKTESTTDLVLHPAYPNPFNPTTTIQYSLPATMEVRLAVFDVLGREVALLAEGTQSAGRHTATFDASHLSNGVYFYTLETPEQTLTGRMSLAK